MTGAYCRITFTTPNCLPATSKRKKYIPSGKSLMEVSNRVLPSGIFTGRITRPKASKMMILLSLGNTSVHSSKTLPVVGFGDTSTDQLLSPGRFITGTVPH